MKKPTHPKLKTVDEAGEDEPIERLKVTSANADADLEALGLLEDDNDSLAAKEIDDLLVEERLVDDRDLDRLFTEQKANKHDDVQIEVRKALYQEKTSKANLMRSKSSDAIKTTLAEEVASYSSLEDEWDGTVKEKANKTVVCIAIALLVALIGGGAWAFWKLRQHDAVANKAEVDALKVDFIQKLERQKEATVEIRLIEKVFNEYLNAVSVEEKMKYLFYDPSLKQEVLAYYHTFKDEKLEDVKVERVMEEMVNTQKVWSMVYSHGHGQNQSQDWLYFRKDKANDYKIDWKSHVNYQAASVNEAIVSKLSEPFEIRAMINPRFEDGQYNWGFTEEKYWAYRIELFDGKVLWGYVDREDTYLQRSMLKGSELSRSFAKVYPKLKIKMILSVCFPEGTDELNTQCLEIKNIVSNHSIDLRDGKSVEEHEVVFPGE